MKFNDKDDIICNLSVILESSMLILIYGANFNITVPNVVFKKNKKSTKSVPHKKKDDDEIFLKIILKILCNA